MHIYIQKKRVLSKWKILIIDCYRFYRSSQNVLNIPLAKLYSDGIACRVYTATTYCHVQSYSASRFE